MATYTKNYNLIKPDLTDLVDVANLNDNFDTIDTKIKEAADAIPPVATVEVAGIVKPDGTTVTVDEDGTIHGAQTYVLPTASADTLGGVKIGDNLTINANGRLNAYASVQTDNVPTKDSTNVPQSGGTYTMINNLLVQVSNLEGQVTALTTGINWLAAVATQADIAITYTTPADGDTVMCLDTGNAYQYNGTEWALIFASLVSAATVAETQAVLEVVS